MNRVFMYEIPLGKLDEGMMLCAQNVRRFVKDSEILLNDSSCSHALALAIFACEELAKYSELKKAKESAQGDSAIVDDRLFCNHDYKLGIARSLMPSDTMTLIHPYFDEKYFSNYFAIKPVEASHPLRLGSVFVNWKSGSWTHEPGVNAVQIRKFTQAILDALNGLESGSVVR